MHTKSNKSLLISLILCIFMTVSACTAIKQALNLAESYFDNGPVQLEPVDEEFFKLKQDYYFVDRSGKKWKAPIGAQTDGASIPSIFVLVIGDKLDPNYLDAAIIHDAYCGRENIETESFQTETWEDVHRMFYEAALAGGTHPIKAKIMYAAVYLGGPRWDDPERNISLVPEEDLKQELEWCMQLVEDQGATVEELEDWMREREPNLISGNIVKPSFAK